MSESTLKITNFLVLNEEQTKRANELLHALRTLTADFLGSTDLRDEEIACENMQILVLCISRGLGLITEACTRYGINEDVLYETVFEGIMSGREDYNVVEDHLATATKDEEVLKN